MAEEDPSGPEQQPEPTLDDVIAEYQPTPSAPSQPSQQAPAQPTPSAETPSAPEVPDPYDENQFKSWAQKVSEQDSALHSEVQTLKSELSQWREQEQQRRVEADIKATVEELNSDLNADPDFVEASLEMMARKKPGFQQIWNNRHANPQAWEKAKRAAKSEIQRTLSVKTDPNLVESQQAVEASQRHDAAGSRTSQNPTEERLASATSQAEFDRIWQEIRSGG